MPPLNISTDEFPHFLVVQASAGTGKTYSVAAIVTIELAEKEELRIGQILITTYTRNAAAELRDRIRKRLVTTAKALRDQAEPGDDQVLSRLQQGPAEEIRNRIGRLERAIVEFDRATITTIHGVCSRVLQLAGMEGGSISDTDQTDQIVAEAVNDLVVNESAGGRFWKEGKIRPIIDAMRQDPHIVPQFDPELPFEDQERLNLLLTRINDCIGRIHRSMTKSPSFNDLLRIAVELVAEREDLLAVLQDRFRLAIVDEAQDTDCQQWDFFNRLFPGGDGRRLISVGDPKQAIYGFRGADVRAYVQHVQQQHAVRRSLEINRRSSFPLLEQLNTAFANREFGNGILYQPVQAADENQEPRIQGMAGSVEFVGLGRESNRSALAQPVLGKVIELLNNASMAEDGALGAPPRQLVPKDICILVRTGEIARLVQQALGRAGIPSVTAGTASVMKSRIALDIRSLLEAMERPSDLGRVRRAAATIFFGHSLAGVGALDDENSVVIQNVQNQLLEFTTILSRKGIATLGGKIESDQEMMIRIARGRYGERNVTDFLHIIEVMDSAGSGKGCSAEQALRIFSQLANRDEKHELVARRVESDADAVKIYTIHAAKGLEFPCVIVADLWKNPQKPGKPNVFYNDQGQRIIDLSYAIGKKWELAEQQREEAECEEAKRLLYVAATRAQHYLALLVAYKEEDLPHPILEQTMTLPDLVEMNQPVPLGRELLNHVQGDLHLTLAPLPMVTQTFRRMSFTGIAAGRGHVRDRVFDPEGGGYDEGERSGGGPLPNLPGLAAHDGEDVNVNHTVIDFPAGVAVGRVIHEIFEHVDPTAEPLNEEVQRVVEERVKSDWLRERHPELIEVVTQTLATPLGPLFGDVTLGAIGRHDRLSELTFEIGLASLADGVSATRIGELLQRELPENDVLRPYADLLAGPAFDVPVGGLLTGSIDALLRLPDSTTEKPRLLIVDYKSNKLHKREMPDPLRAYAPDRLVAAMVEHHYPLQALLYGTAVYRLLRWRLPNANPDDCIAGIAYAFIRGMKGPETPVDQMGHRYGVFAWQAPPGLWQNLSNILVQPPLGDAI
jgi:exodeoxyribonuclease V beta subunit